MKQDDFVLHASEGHIASVQEGLAEKRLCSVKGTHQEKVILWGGRRDEILGYSVNLLRRSNSLN